MMQSLPRYARRLLAIAFGVFLGGCEILPEAPPVQVLDPQPRTAGERATGPAPWRLEVLEPMADPMRGGEQVLVRTADGRLQVLGNTRWVSPPPLLLHSLLLRHLRDSGALAEVGSAVNGADRQLALDLRAFELREQAEALEAVVQVEARLYNTAPSRLLARQLFTHRVPAPTTGGSLVLDSFEQALAALLTDLDAWLLAQSPPG